MKIDGIMAIQPCLPRFLHKINLPDVLAVSEVAIGGGLHVFFSSPDRQFSVLPLVTLATASLAVQKIVKTALLIVACHSESVDVVKQYCCSFGFRLYFSMTGESLLHCAVENPDLEVLDYLLKKAPNERACYDSEGMTPLHCAVVIGRIPAVRLLINVPQADHWGTEKTDDTILHIAANNGDEPMLREIYERLPEGYSKNPVNRYRMTPLHMAAAKGHVAAARVILNHVENKVEAITQRSLNGNTSYSLAVQYHSQDVLALFNEYLPVAIRGLALLGERVPPRAPPGLLAQFGSLCHFLGL